MEKKTDIVRKAVAGGDWKKALSIAKGFKLGISKEQQRVITRAYECMVHPDFYTSLGYDLNAAISDGVSVLTSIYG